MPDQPTLVIHLPAHDSAVAAGEPVTVDVRVKRIYDEPAADDGYRVLIDHVWPRGVSRDRAQLDAWARELAPSDDLRRWFAHDPAKFAEFRARYRDELAGSDVLLDLAGARGATRSRSSTPPATRCTTTPWSSQSSCARLTNSSD